MVPFAIDVAFEVSEQSSLVVLNKRAIAGTFDSDVKMEIDKETINVSVNGYGNRVSICILFYLRVDYWR